jgi:hypothetical protein
MSLRLRLTIIYSALTGGILLVFGILLYSLVEVRLVNQVDETLWQASQQLLVNSVVDVTGEPNMFNLQNLGLTSEVYVQVWDTSGKLHISSPGLNGLILEPLDPVSLASKQTIYRNANVQKVPMRVLTVPLVAGSRDRKSVV